MADNLEHMGVTAAIAAGVVAIREIGGGMLRFFKTRAAKEDERIEADRDSKAKEIVWKAIRKLDDKIDDHDKRDIAIQTEQSTILKGLKEVLDEVRQDVKAIKRDTGKVDRGR